MHYNHIGEILLKIQVYDQMYKSGQGEKSM